MILYPSLVRRSFIVDKFKLLAELISYRNTIESQTVLLTKLVRSTNTTSNRVKTICCLRFVTCASHRKRFKLQI